ncbi:MAG: phosphonate ABC transporter, permease protein PhnE [Nitrososphaerota archaeon]
MRGQRPPVGLAVQLAIAVVTLSLLIRFGAFDPAVVARFGNLPAFVAGMLPPDPRPLPTLVMSMIETVMIAFAGTSIAVALSVPLALLSTRSLFGDAVTVPLRFVLSVIRTVPSIIWALIFVVTVGFGPLAGVLGTAMYSTGYLSKLLYEAFDAVDREVLEAIRVMRVGKLAEMRYVVLPEAANYVLSQSLFMFEYNVRASAILGLVGAGGIGFYILAYVQVLDYRSLSTALIVLLAFVLAVDFVSSRVRKRFLPD